ncbi:MAG: hypothetical protein ACXAD7_03160 [Candidatus Kariarchaeaceae archaeon]|jgi:hypothetical protein
MKKIVVFQILFILTSSVFLSSTPINQNDTDLSILDTELIHTIYEAPNSLWLNFHNEEPHTNSIVISTIQFDDFGNLWVSGTLLKDQTLFFDDDAFLSKINPNGEIEWMKLYEGSGLDTGLYGIEFDSEGNVVIAFQTTSRDLPIINAEAYYYPNAISFDLYIEKMDPSGNVLWSTYFGGPYFEAAAEVIVDEQDNVYLTGIGSGGPFFPVKDSFYNANEDAEGIVIAKFFPNGTLEWSTVIELDGILGSTYFGNGQIIFAGTSDETNAIVPNSNSSYTGGRFAIIEVNVTSKEIVWGNLYGGNGNGFEFGGAVDMDGANNILQTGGTASVFNVTNGIDTTLNQSDALIVKYNSSRHIEWSTYLGGSSFEDASGVIFDDNGDVIIVGVTSSPDFPFADTSTSRGLSDVFITKINGEGTQILMSTLFGGDQDEGDIVLAGDDVQLEYLSGSIYTASETESDIDDLYANGTKLEPNYPFTFGGKTTGFIYQLNAETFAPERLLTAVVVPGPDLDYDGDGLTNWDEYRLFVDDGIAVDPFNWDTDGDGLPDGWEIEFGLSPNDIAVPSGDFDSFDADGLTNLQEFQFGTLPNNTDTDHDGMDDWFEFDNGLNGTHDDTQEDADGDEMSNIYEFDNSIGKLGVNGLNASNALDGNFDPDEDDAVNTIEYLAGTDPFDWDTDGDGLPDGYEIANNLDATTSNVGKDSDGDFIPDSVEYKYRRFGLNPDSKIELFIEIGIFTAIIGTILFFRIRGGRRNKQAKKNGFDGYGHQRRVQETGYNSLEDSEDAKSRGFRLAKAEESIGSLNFKTVSEYQGGLEKLNQDLISTYTNDFIDSQLASIQSTKTPVELHQLKSQFIVRRKNISSSLTDLEKIMSVHQEILKLFKNNKEVFVSLDQAEIELNQRQIDKLHNRLNGFISKMENEFDQRETWFKPWSSLLKLIQITEDDKPIILDDIREVVETSDEQAEGLLKSLLEENPQIGSYDVSTKTYAKSKGAEVTAYLEKALKLMEDLEDEYL